jgi:hypothetical protein
MRAWFLIASLLLAVAAPALAASAPSPTPRSPLAHRGFVTDRATAEHAIAFRPFIPAGELEAVALEPPFHGAQVSANEGIAYAYRHAARTWILTEWPQNGGSIAQFATLGEVQPRCGALHAVGGSTHPRGVVWTTPRGLVMSLLPDGTADRRTLVAEWRRLIRRGAC